MPGLASSAYNSVESILNRIRMILNDSEVAGGDVFTDTAPFTFDCLNLGFERVQIQLAGRGIETFKNEAWLIGVPAISVFDPEARVIINDAGSTVVYPNNPGAAFFSLTPQLPTDLVYPLKLWERANGTTGFVGGPMKQRNGGLANISQQNYLIDWEWKNDGLRFRGALQVIDVKIEYERSLPKLVAPGDSVPIRGVGNAVSYESAKAFCESRGGAISPAFAKNATDELEALYMTSSRRRQRKQVRRQPYSGRGNRSLDN